MWHHCWKVLPGGTPIKKTWPGDIPDLLSPASILSSAPSARARSLTLSGPKRGKKSRIPSESSKCRSSRRHSSLCSLICGSSSSWGGAASALVPSERRWAGGLDEDVSQRRKMEGIDLPPPFHLPPTPSDRLQTNTLHGSKHDTFKQRHRSSSEMSTC